jgi:small subunit ribosomal protein S17
MDLRIQERIMKDVRQASKGRTTSAQRLKRARKQGYSVPSLEEAMANVRLAEEEERLRVESGKGGKKVGERGEKHGGQAGQFVTAKERRLERGRETKEEKVAADKVREARKQTV